MNSFDFTKLPSELRTEVIHIAASPRLEKSPKTRRAYYSTALTLCTVSHSIRYAAMQRLLHTVILCSRDQVFSFIESIRLQTSPTFQSLALDYEKLVQKFWSADCWEWEFDDISPFQSEDYRSLYSVIRGVQTLGFNNFSQHLLYRGLEFQMGPEYRQCRRLVLAGMLWTWNPLTSTEGSSEFLEQITHIVLWVEGSKVPTKKPAEFVPFHKMPNLTHFAFLVPEDSTPALMRDGVRSQIEDARGDSKGVQIQPIVSWDNDWEHAFLRGDDERLWCEAGG
jgi:hypothetical protein